MVLRSKSVKHFFFFSKQFTAHTRTSSAPYGGTYSSFVWLIRDVPAEGLSHVHGKKKNYLLIHSKIETTD